jgi:hypothetical protein
MRLGATALGLALAAVVTASLAPALDARAMLGSSVRSTIGPALGYFTPAGADPRLSAIYAGNGPVKRGFRFTPAVTDQGRSVTVAVRANRLVTPSVATSAVSASVAPAPATGTRLESMAYNLGSSMGWKRFALKGDTNGLDRARLPAKAESPAKSTLPAGPSKWSTRVQLETERLAVKAPRTLEGSENLSVDVGGAFRLSRNLDVTAGVRYKTDRDRLQKLADDRRDSQAVYVGTAFRF